MKDKKNLKKVILQLKSLWQQNVYPLTHIFLLIFLRRIKSKLHFFIKSLRSMNIAQQIFE